MTSIVSSLSSSASSSSAPGSALQDSSCAQERPLPGLLQDRAQRKALRLAWSRYVHQPRPERRGPSARDLAVYCLLLGKPLSRSFSPVTNTVKLDNGQQPWGALLETLRRLDATVRGVDLQQLLLLLEAPRVEVPSKRVGSGVQWGYTTTPVRDELLQVARQVTATALAAGQA